MKVVLIHGQNHKGSSYHIGRMIADKMQGTNEIIEFFLPRDLNHFCLGCYNCIEDDACCRSCRRADFYNADILYARDCPDEVFYGFDFYILDGAQTQKMYVF